MRKCRHREVRQCMWLGEEWAMLPRGHRLGVSARCCYDCGQWLPLGPANDTAAVRVEVRAAELAAGFIASGRKRWEGRTHMEWLGDQMAKAGVVPLVTDGELAGYLARCIAEHGQ